MLVQDLNKADTMIIRLLFVYHELVCTDLQKILDSKVK